MDEHDGSREPPLCPPAASLDTTTTAAAAGPSDDHDESDLSRLMGSMQPRHRRQQYVYRPARQFRRSANKFACFKCQKKKTTVCLPPFPSHLSPRRPCVQQWQCSHPFLCVQPQR
jgi:hypothetical protein